MEGWHKAEWGLVSVPKCEWLFSLGCRIFGYYWPKPIAWLDQTFNSRQPDPYEMAKSRGEQWNS